MQQVQNALWMDYEGNTGRPPTLLGWMCQDKTEGAIVEPLFKTCENRFRAKDLWLRDHCTLLHNLIVRAETEDRLIVSWSEHDWRHMCTALNDASWIERLGHRYRNAIPTAKAWHRRHHGSSPDLASLEHFLGLVGYVVPERFGSGLVGAHLRMIRAQLQQCRAYPDLSPRARANWVAVVKHNRHDLKGMAIVMRAATGDS